MSFSVKDGKNPLLTTTKVSVHSHKLYFKIDMFCHVYSGQYDARARVLIRHVSCLLRVSQQQLEEFEETLGESLREAGEESE